MIRRLIGYWHGILWVQVYFVTVIMDYTLMMTKICKCLIFFLNISNIINKNGLAIMVTVDEICYYLERNARQFGITSYLLPAAKHNATKSRAHSMEHNNKYWFTWVAVYPIYEEVHAKSSIYLYICIFPFRWDELSTRKIMIGNCKF